jgi:hypothetical protein
MFVDVGVLVECGDGKFTTKPIEEDQPLHIQYERYVQQCAEKKIAKLGYEEWLSTRKKSKELKSDAL